MSEAAVPGGMRSRFGAASLLSDDRLAQRAVKGDERAFAAIFNRYHQDLFRYCTAIVGNATDAQDALQNTMVKVLRALPGEDREIELKPWLYRIAHNEAIELLRRRRPTEELDPELLSRGGGLAEDAERRDRLRGLLDDLDQLPERQRGALVMRELAGLGFGEIAASLGTSEGVARQTLYEARQSLRQMDEGREMSCEAVTRALSDADGRVTRRRDIRAHLRACADCRRFRDEVAARRQDFAALAPLPAVAAAGLLQGVLGGAGGSPASGAGLAGAAGGGAAKSLGAAAAIKSAAAVGVIAAVGVGAADRGGLVDATPWSGGAGQAQGERSGGAGADGSRPQGSQRAPGSKNAGSGAARADAGSAALGAAAAVEGGSVAAGNDGGNAHPRSSAAGGNPGGPAGNGAGGTHPRGRGHEKQHPEAASHGQQTAAGRQEGGARGGTESKAPKPARSPKPVEPTQPPAPPKQSNQSATSGQGTGAVPPKEPAVPEAAPPSATASPAGAEQRSQGAPAEPGE